MSQRYWKFARTIFHPPSTTIFAFKQDQYQNPYVNFNNRQFSLLFRTIALHHKGWNNLYFGSRGNISYSEGIIQLELFDDVLKEYTLKDDNGNEVNVGEKRIYAPNFFRIENGKATKMTDGISEKQEDPRGELTEEIIEDEKKMFEELFR